MWLNEELVLDAVIRRFRKTVLHSTPRHVVIDNLFDKQKLDEVVSILQQEENWQTQKHTYSSLYVDDAIWQKTGKNQRFVKRDLWQHPKQRVASDTDNTALQFLAFLRSEAFMALLSRIFNVRLTDINVANPDINTNYFRLGAADFVNQHADESPGREVCMLLYLNKNWQENQGGELVFLGTDDKPLSITPFYNRCVLFAPASPGSEHWVKALATEHTQQYRYNVTSWYWSE